MLRLVKRGVVMLVVALGEARRVEWWPRLIIACRSLESMGRRVVERSRTNVLCALSNIPLV